MLSGQRMEKGIYLTQSTRDNRLQPNKAIGGQRSVLCASEESGWRGMTGNGMLYSCGCRVGWVGEGGHSAEEGQAAAQEMEEGVGVEGPGAVPVAEPADTERMEGESAETGE
ncbi:hypothetical protein CDL15_Pgr011907 [Punica granatum]|uniref:Uncharacterized protein n=1 Tax=Punica granatum TaxID=22663 RepID=A0A218WE05_PUNGR|nr:hypothetical protein CDL15_Pgr011907 [Punica granatum]